jgi:hypothetical protein
LIICNGHCINKENQPEKSYLVNLGQIRAPPGISPLGSRQNQLLKFLVQRKVAHFALDFETVVPGTGLVLLEAEAAGGHVQGQLSYRF